MQLTCTVCKLWTTTDQCQITSHHFVHGTAPWWNYQNLTGQKQRQRHFTRTHTPNYIWEITAEMLNWLLWKEATLTCVTQRPWAAGAVSQRGWEPWRCLQELKPQRHCRRGWNTCTPVYNYSREVVWILQLTGDRCVGRKRDWEQMKPCSTDHLPQVFNLLLPQRRWRSSRQDFIGLLPFPTTAKTKADSLVHHLTCEFIRLDNEKNVCIINTHVEFMIQQVSKQFK